MRPLAVCLLLLVPAALAADDDKPEWKRFRPKNGRCAVEMPGKPTAQPPQDISQGGFKSKLYMFLLEAPDGKTAYGLGYSDFPADTLPDEKLKEVLEAAQKGTEKGLKAEVVTDRELRLGKYPGREFTLELPGGNYYRARLFIVEGRLYQVIALGPKKFIDGPDAKVFLYSFELTE